MADDPVKFKSEIVTKLAMAQHLGLISNSKAFIYLKDNKIIKSMKNLSKTDNSI